MGLRAQEETTGLLATRDPKAIRHPYRETDATGDDDVGRKKGPDEIHG